MNPYALSGILAGISSISLGVVVLIKCGNRKLGFIWFLFALSVANYEFGALWFAQAKSAELALLGVRWAYMVGVIWIASLFHHFVCVFLEKNNKHAVVINYLVSLLFCSVIFSPLVFSAAPWSFNSMYFPLGGKLFPLFFIWWMGLVFYSHYQLLQAYARVADKKKNQIKYFFLATAIGFTGGSMGYFADFGIYIYPWGNFTVVLYPLIMAYAIIKHQLMDIRIVIQKTVLSLLGLLIAVAGYIAFIAHYTHREVLPLANFSIFTAILSLVMALFVLIKAPKRKITTMWVLTCLSIAMWSAGFGMMARSATFEQCMFWQRWFLYAGSIMIPVLYLHFVTLLVSADIKWILPASYGVALVFEIINLTGNLVTAKIKPPFNFYTEAIYPVYYFFTVYFFALAVYAHWLLARYLRAAKGILKIQVQYVFIGTAVGFLGGCMTFPLSFNIHVFPIGAYLVAFYLVAVTYAIYRHHLMDINVALRKSLVYSLMTGVLTSFYLVTITQGAHLLQNYFGASTFVVSAFSACFITAIFLPVRNLVQSIVDKYFFRDWSERGEMIREVAAGFSHELKSPLAGLSMQAQMALAGLQEVEDGRESWLKALPRIKKELQYLVNQSMDAARRIEAVRGVAEPIAAQIGPVDVRSVVDSALATFEARMEQVNASIRRDLPPDLPPVRSNEKQLEIVFINLIKNALDAMDGDNKERQSLSLSGQVQNGSVMISVKDTGPGIANRDVGRIFEPYYSTKGRKGTGMGLYLTQQIVKAHGGVIEVKSEEGKGTEFIVRLSKYSAGKDSGLAA